MTLLFLLLAQVQDFNERPHASGKTFCERHLSDWDYSDEQTREYLERKKDKEDE